MVLAVVDDLLFISKIRASAGVAGRSVVFVRNRAQLIPALREHRPDLVLIDLDRDALDPVASILDVLAERTGGPRPSIVGFASHVHVDRMQSAREAGCDEVLARSAFVAALPSLLAASSAEAR